MCTRTCTCIHTHAHAHTCTHTHKPMYMHECSIAHGLGLHCMFSCIPLTLVHILYIYFCIIDSFQHFVHTYLLYLCITLCLRGSFCVLPTLYGVQRGIKFRIILFTFVKKCCFVKFVRIMMKHECGMHTRVWECACVLLGVSPLLRCPHAFYEWSCMCESPYNDLKHVVCLHFPQLKPYMPPPLP